MAQAQWNFESGSIAHRAQAAEQVKVVFEEDWHYIREALMDREREEPMTVREAAKGWVEGHQGDGEQPWVDDVEQAVNLYVDGILSEMGATEPHGSGGQYEIRVTIGTLIKYWHNHTPDEWGLMGGPWTEDEEVRFVYREEEDKWLLERDGGDRGWYVALDERFNPCDLPIWE